MTSYNADALYALANKLEKGTKGLIVTFTIMGALMGAAIGAVVGFSMSFRVSLHVTVWTILLAVYGFVAGRERVFKMKLKAQEVLCQARIEENTRPKAEAVSSAAAAR